MNYTFAFVSAPEDTIGFENMMLQFPTFKVFAFS